MKILVLNGVNINMTGLRGALYGSQTLDEINARLSEYARERGVELECFQSNIEGELVNRLHRGGFDGVVINAGAYSHYSYAIADALECCAAKKVEVHMTNILAREEFRQKSVIARACDGCIAGFGVYGYMLAIDYLLSACGQ